MVEKSKKCALVVGGSTGVGHGVAEALSEQGYEVHILSRSEPVGHEQYHFQWHPCDLKNTVESKKILADIAVNDMDFVCFSAAFYGIRRCGFMATEWPLWQEQSAIMIDGLWLTLSAFLPGLIRRRGIFLGISSEVAFNAGPGRAGYTACKAAAMGLLGSIAAEIPAEQVIIAQALPEGMVDSPGIRSRRPADFDYSGYMQPEDFKAFICSLVIQRNADLHGQTVMVKRHGNWCLVDDRHSPPSQSIRSAL
ncbi:NAD(P)-dependent oxidoreductase [Prodigiosinella confusarubida]|uniref:NAD(P)-dependent oxidoreductase n=1 Tax=Serratia sp. (strain ATCC 39006) TaxID=104623 RepID=A0A2I5T3A5_SERS3|nr:SDR family oxidoreductase [Serratia sp. ATCC 39006]AUG99046.1 NAD(P)-dependent oxidoreductase [Serratia sp. ATCC 39006]AUH03361.1 NAD(P)-dependent oxidoreductase [Serratia sp. ATCC 39006]WJY15341.1 SDR family oxidoreductase [Pectobacteriaceae bacterium CE90]